MHWTNAAAMLVMITSGWGIYDDDVIITRAALPAVSAAGRLGGLEPQLAFRRHVVPGDQRAVLLRLRLFTGRLRERLLPIRLRDVIHTVNDTLHFKIAHEDLTTYNAVQKILYIVVMLAGISQVVTGIAIWKPVQFSGLVRLLGGFQRRALIHFAGMAVIVGFLVVHVALSLLVPQHAVGDADRRSRRLRPASQRADRPSAARA